MKTNLELVQHCEKALKEKWFYLWGSYAQLSTQATINNLLKQWPKNEKYRAEFEKTIGKTRLCDCYGLVKSYLWWTGDKTDPKVVVSQDVNTTSAFSKAKEKGLLSTLPEIPGIILWMQGHVGVYIGNGRFIECCFSARGMQEGLIQNGKIIKGNKFTHWFKDINIEYLGDDEMVDTTKININGNIYTVKRIFKDEKNYIELQSLKLADFKVEYDAVNNMPIIYTPKN